MKSALADLPKDSYRFRKKTNPYAGVGVHIYFKDTDTLRTLTPWLKSKALYQDKGLEGDKLLLPYQILDEAKAAVSEVKGRSLS